MAVAGRVAIVPSRFGLACRASRAYPVSVVIWLFTMLSGCSALPILSFRASANFMTFFASSNVIVVPSKLILSVPLSSTLMLFPSGFTTPASSVVAIALAPPTTDLDQYSVLLVAVPAGTSFFAK